MGGMTESRDARVHALRSARARVEAAERELDDARAQRDDAILAALDAGMGATEIATEAGVTRVRVYQVKGREKQ